jgi:hypothetical protein
VGEAVLVIREGADAGHEVRLGGECVVGRAPESDLVLADAGISRNHARITAGADGPIIEDLGSSNGTLLNGQPLAGPEALRDGDEIQLGEVILAFMDRPGEAQPLAAAGAQPQPPPPPSTPHIPPPPARREPAREPQPQPAIQRDVVDNYNLPAVAAILLGPLSILLLAFSSGSGFYAALPIAISAVALGNIGRNKVDRGETRRYRRLAVAGRKLGVIGTILGSIVLIAVIVVTQAFDVSAESIGELFDEIRQQIESA